MIQKEHILALVDEERYRLKGIEEIDTNEVTRVYIQIRNLLRNVDFTRFDTPLDLFELCERVDTQIAALNPEPNLAIAIREARTRIGNTILQEFAAEKLGKLKPGQVEQVKGIVHDRELSRAVWELIFIVKRGALETFSPAWIEETSENGFYARFIHLILDPETRRPNWELVKSMLPASLRDRFILEPESVPVVTEENLTMAIEEYREIAERLGPEALAQFLISLGRAGQREFSQIVRIISRYLGRCNVKRFKPTDIAALPESFLQLTGIADLIFIQLRIYIYQELTTLLPETADPSQFEIVLHEIDQIARQALDPSKQVHKKILDDIMEYYREILTMPVPERLVSRVETKERILAPFPSLRQRIAMKEMKDGRRKLVSFFMGTGKTATAFLSKEHVGAKKMLYICPPHLVDQTKERVSKYYQEGKEPTVGIIEAGINPPQLAKALDCEIVICPFSMFHSERDGISIRDAIKTAGFDFITVDEAHWAKEPGKHYTETVYDFVNTIPRLYEEGYVLLLSGDPVPNTPDDIVPQLRIYDRERYRDAKSLSRCVRRADPMVLRNALLDFMIIVDPPEDWERYIRLEEFDLSEPERRVYQAIWENESLTHAEKLRFLCLALLNPDLYSATPVQSSIFEECVSRTKEYLVDYKCVVIGENNYVHGVTQRHNQALNVMSFAERMAAEFAGQAIVKVIDGDTPMKSHDPAVETRETILQASRQLTDGQKMILIVRTPTIREGLDLSHIHRAVLLEPSYNDPDAAQFVKRFAREGNTNVEVTVLQPSDTVYEGIRDHAHHKAILGHRLKYGGTLTEEEADYTEGGNLDTRVRFYEGGIWIGTPLAEKTMTDIEKLLAMFKHLHGKGAEYFRSFMEVKGEEFARLYMKNWIRSYSANNGRFVGGLIETLESLGIIEGDRFGDIGCGPMVLENIFAGSKKKRQLTNVDLCQELVEAGKLGLKERLGDQYVEPKVTIASMADMKSHLADGQLDVVNYALSVNYTDLNVQRVHKERDERVQALCEMNRVLRTGGIAIITLPRDVCMREEFQKFAAQMAHFGFEVLTEYTGAGKSTDSDPENETETVFENYTLVCKKTGALNLDQVDLKHLKFSRVAESSVQTPGPAKPRKKPTEGKGSLHQEFQVQDVSITFAEGIVDEKAREAEYKAHVERARDFLVEIYHRNKNTFENLTPEDRQAIEQRGICLLNLDLGNDIIQRTFTLKQRPDVSHLLFR